MGARQSSLSNVQSSAFSRRQLRAHRINRTGMDHSQISNAPKYVRKATAAPNSTDLELIGRAMAGDPSAHEQLFKVHAAKLYRRAFVMLRNKEDAEDALQESWIRAYTSLKSFEGRSSFSTWLMRIVINSALMILRKNRSASRVSVDVVNQAARVPSIHQIPDGSPNPEQYYAAAELRRILNKAICGLRPRIRAVVEFGQLQELSVKETARGLGISVGAAKGRLFHARATLQRSAVLRAIAKVRTSLAVRVAPRFAPTAPRGRKHETTIHPGLVSHSASPPSGDDVSGNSICTVAGTLKSVRDAMSRPW